MPWITDFLKDRYIRVKFKDTVSGRFRLSQVIPKGSVLRSTLFSLFISSIEAKTSARQNIGLYADDIIVWSSNSCLLLLRKILILITKGLLTHRK